MGLRRLLGKAQEMQPASAWPSLRAAFARAAVAHLVIDVQGLYCDPAHPLARDWDRDFTRHHKLALNVAEFVKASRSILEPVWVVNGAQYLSSFRVFMPAGLKNPRRFCRENLYMQEPLDSDPMFVKPGMDAFIGTELNLFLREQGRKALLLSGVSAGACIRVTANSAQALGYDVYLMDDLIGGEHRPPYVVRRYIDRMGWKRISSDDVLSLIETAPSPGLKLPDARPS